MVKTKFLDKKSKISQNIIMNKKLWIIIHHSRFGSEVFLVKSKKCPSRKAIIKTFDINFEEEKDEWIEIIEANPKEPVEM